MKTIHKSAKLANVCYDIRGPIMDRARQMEEEGQKIIKLNIGNLAVFGFDAPEEIQQDMIRNLPNSAGYSDSKGIFAARKAVMHETQKQGIRGVTLDDIYLGNGASELIVMATNGLLDDGDEVLLPAPDYPLWTAAASLSGGTPVHYLCDEANGWMPNLDDIRTKITPRTKAIVVINPNNPTGALYSDELLLAIVAIAREHGLVIFADEVYDKVLYEGARHTAMAKPLYLATHTKSDVAEYGEMYVVSFGCGLVRRRGCPFSRHRFNSNRFGRRRSLRDRRLRDCSLIHFICHSNFN